jgi:16S rRNA (guanine966-N2)-methyltransferase
MRVISGQAKGRKLTAAVPKTTRPTSDRVKEAIFDILYSSGGVVDAAVADLFCGTGGLGIEALSRGARSVTFVDDSLAAIKAVEDNLFAVGLMEATTVRHRAALPGWVAPSPFDIILCDPPYGFTDWDALLSDVVGDLVIIESDAPVVVSPPYVVTKSRTYGTTLVTVLERDPMDDIL